MPITSLIVATYNWPEALNLCLLSIKSQKVLPAEVIIADDGSDQRTKLLIEKFQQNFPVPLIHVWHEDLGFRKSIVLNMAIKQAAGNYIVQVDGDVILDQNFINDHQSVAEKDVFVRGTRAHITKARLPELYRTSRISFNFLSRGIINRFNAIRLPLFAFLFEKKIKSSERVRGSNLAYWKADFILINGYNNELKGWGHEDEELAARFINNEKLKKAIKFKAIQFHLSHGEAPRTYEQTHSEFVKNTVQSKIKVCSNGIAQL
ncbi:glycosyltransferase family 2 protein [Pedobacter sp. PAMC26386]|nr:glycosyltransferase family 2 protein [Pedobacter sp. PAMC26386]